MRTYFLPVIFLLVTFSAGRGRKEPISPVDGIILYMPYAPPLNSGESSPLVVGLLNPAPPVVLKKVRTSRGGDQPHTLPLLM